MALNTLRILFCLTCLFAQNGCDDAQAIVEPDPQPDAMADEIPRIALGGASTTSDTAMNTGETEGQGEIFSEGSSGTDSGTDSNQSPEAVDEASVPAEDNFGGEDQTSAGNNPMTQGGAAADDGIDETDMDTESAQSGGATITPNQPLTLTARITEPTQTGVYEVGTAVTFTGQVSDENFTANQITVRWSSDQDGELFLGVPNAQGMTVFSSASLSAGFHLITLEATTPDGQTVRAEVRIGVCTLSRPETFDIALNSNHWRIYGDAYWDPGGWLEMTGVSRGQKGAIFNVRDRVSPGDVSISFRIWTGGGDGGADGFAMSVFDARTVEELDQIFADARTGGGLGYGVSGAYGTWDVDGFHVEFDTWHNVDNGDTELHTDPTEENHIAVLTNGDPGTHHLWAEIPTIEDQQWHDVTIQVDDEQVVITLDDITIIEGAVPGLRFKGGFIGFSGTTGFYTNYHRFDNLQILQECDVP